MFTAVSLGGIVTNLAVKRRAARRGVPVCPQTAKAAGKFRWQQLRNGRRPSCKECRLSRQVRGRRLVAGALQLDE